MDHLEGKKILFLITQSKYGGAQKYILQLARHFSKKNEVLIAIGNKDHQDAFFMSEAKNIGITPIVLSSLIRDISLVKAFDAVMEIRKLLVKERPDILHINSSMAGAVGSCAAWLYRFDPLNRVIRVVYTVHGFVFNEPMPPAKKIIYRLVEKISSSWKGALITVSQFDKDEGIRHKIAPASRMQVIHNGIEPHVEFLDPADAKKELGISEASTFNIGTVASLYPTKGITYLIRALAELRDQGKHFHYTLLGDGPDRAEIELLILELHLSDYITLVGAKENSYRYLKAFDLFVLPSVKEGFPYALLEAGSASLPVIATRVGGIPELITNQTNGILVPSGDPHELSTAIASLMSEPALRNTYAKKLHDTVSRHFTLEKMLNETEKLYLRFYTPLQ